MEKDVEKIIRLRDAAREVLEATEAWLKCRKPPQMELSDITDKFPSDIRRLLNFEHKGDQIVVKPKGFLGKDVFNRVAGVVKEIGGVYVSEGKESRFLISPKAK